MPFLTQAKTNWKFLLIVIVLAVIAGGGILYCVKRQEASLTEFPEAEKQIEIIISSPAENDQWIVGGTYQISWTPSDPARTIGIMLIDTRIPAASLSKVWQVENVPDTGSYSFIVPNVSPGNQYKIYISSEEKRGYSNLFSITEYLPEEIKSNKEFINWMTEWQSVKPIYAADKFTKVDEQPFNLNGNPIDAERLEIARDTVKSPYFPEERKKHVEIYSPDKTKLIWNAGYPDPFEIDQDVVLFNLSTNKYQFLKGCGTACWFEKVFWIDDYRFVVIRTGEYHSPGYEAEEYYDYSHSIFFYDLENDTVSEYQSSEIILSKEIKAFQGR